MTIKIHRSSATNTLWICLGEASLNIFHFDPSCTNRPTPYAVTYKSTGPIPTDLIILTRHIHAEVGEIVPGLVAGPVQIRLTDEQAAALIDVLTGVIEVPVNQHMELPLDLVGQAAA